MSQRVPEILVVDDAAENLRQLSEMLMQNGCRVRQAQSGKDGLSSAAAAPPELILLDVRMPEMGGYEVCQRLKEDPRLREIPVIFVSALDEISDKIRGFEVGGVDYIVKPYQLEEVLARVKTHVELRRLQLNLRQAHDRIDAALQRELLLNREIHHRVKNNLQVISSLLFLQAHHSADPRTQEALREGQARIRSIALIHEKLYGSSDLKKIECAGYTRQLASDLFQAYNVSQDAIRLELNTGEGLCFSLDEAIPFGLIVTELVSNALKHGFPRGKAGRIRVNLWPLSGGRLELCVRDDGIGLPDDLDVAQTKTFGLQMVRDLARQLNGLLNFQRGCNGTVVTLTFPNHI